MMTAQKPSDPWSTGTGSPLFGAAPVNTSANLLGGAPLGQGAGSPLQAPVAANSSQQTFAAQPSPPKLVGVAACKQLVYAPVKAPAELKAFQTVKDMAYMRVVRKRHHTGRLQERVLVLSRACLLITDMGGSVKRFMKYSEIASVCLQKQNGLWQMLVQCNPPEHDVMLHLVDDARNSHIGNSDEEIQTMADVYIKIASTFNGQPASVDWKEDSSEDLSKVGKLKKQTKWESPASRWKRDRKARANATGSPQAAAAATATATATGSAPPSAAASPMAMPEPVSSQAAPSSPIFFATQNSSPASPTPSFGASPASPASSSVSGPLLTIAEFDADASVTFGAKPVQPGAGLDDDDWGPITSASSANTSVPSFEAFVAPQATFSSGSPSFKPSSSPTFKPPSFGSFTAAKPVAGTL
eukprot:TRINITY_DN2939_c0_g3_i1.p1 TRINITY_DN2939_c0_g3~~TRINITY_DN2939_c0_g3_i1.p1  ORF type:complete len:413 (+),score=60.33 TRINITY_DN2939_c0_g3_i1:63-1301(+)